MNVVCIKCGAKGNEERIAVDLDNGDIHCGSCDETFTVGEVEELVAGWAKVLPWLRQHPALQPACGAVQAAG